jgi:hypothetical protein
MKRQKLQFCPSSFLAQCLQKSKTGNFDPNGAPYSEEQKTLKREAVQQEIWRAAGVKTRTVFTRHYFWREGYADTS